MNVQQRTPGESANAAHLRGAHARRRGRRGRAPLAGGAGHGRVAGPPAEAPPARDGKGRPAPFGGRHCVLTSLLAGVPWVFLAGAVIAP